MPLKTSGAMNDEIVVGYSYEVENIINKLIRGSIEMYIVPIIRIPRIGGTTLAKKEYNDPSVTFHFHILVWKKVFHKDSYPDVLVEVGKLIARNCQGLPLVVFVIDSLLGRTEKKLGFSRTSNLKSLEDLAEECLLDLIARSLVTIVKRGSDGWVKRVFHHIEASRPLCCCLLFFVVNDTNQKNPMISHSFVTSINIGSSFPEGLEQLVRLRYLAVRGEIRFPHMCFILGTWTKMTMRKFPRLRKLKYIYLE
ncbi:hypothetical protein M9H77_23811 [Catharanthus roseus]|uniref:Uncharacterized protein n=1 Tax=Catharanthus roseus TaxID=4058 RepID=A0ACC0AX50_CATRO|nr:hypothetical protein M9H77_23811 [Catharanthus roseus]